MTQLRLERNLGEAVRLLQARQTQFHFTSEIDKGSNQALAGFDAAPYRRYRWGKGYR